MHEANLMHHIVSNAAKMFAPVEEINLSKLRTVHKENTIQYKLFMTLQFQLHMYVFVFY